MSENLGAYQVDHVTADVTDLTNANNEPLATWADESSIDRIDGVSVVGVENAGTYNVQYDHLEEDVYVVGHDGTDPTAGTDVGEITLRLEGRS